MGSQHVGKVYLVGAGPGDPGLITLRAVECLRMADVVIHDRLINHSLLAYAPQAEWIDVGKESNHHPIPQSQINDLLVTHARSEKIVIRLKGGDPFVFGRGGEEALALAQAGIPFEVVPGVTSAIAVPAYAGIPITHRGLAASAAIITGHQADCKKNGSSDPNALWKRLAGKADTLVFLMGVTNLPCIVQELIESGLPPQTPVALIEQGTCPDQKTITGCLENICGRAANIRPPAVIVVGEVVELRENIRWFDLPVNRPLLGLRILHTRSAAVTGEPDEFSRKLATLGADALELPVCQIQPAEGGALDQAIHRLATNHSGWDWVLFPDPLSVTSFFQRLNCLGYDTRSLHTCQVAAMGETTRSSLERYGVKADLRIDPGSGRNSIGMRDLYGKQILLPACPDEHISLIRALQEQEAAVDVVEAYHLLPPDPNNSSTLQILLSGELDGVVFFHPAEIRALANMLVGRTNASLREILVNLKVTCATVATAETARALGVRVDDLPETDTVDGVCAGLEQIYLVKGKMES